MSACAPRHNVWLTTPARVGNGERPLCGVEPHLIRQLRRELEGEPQPQPLAWMSASDAVP